MAISLCKLMKHTFVVGGGLQTDYLIFKKICIFSIVSEFQLNSGDVTGHL